MATIVRKGVGKRYDAAAAKIAPDKHYAFDEAIALVKSMPSTKFDQSVDLSFRLGVDPKHADQMVRGAVVLPHGIGKTVRVAVFAKGEKEREDRKSTRLNSSHLVISYAVFCLKKKKRKDTMFNLTPLA